MLTTTQRERIVCHLQRGWKLPDSLIQELWEAYVALEQAHIQASILPEAPQDRLAHRPAAAGWLTSAASNTVVHT